MIKKRGENFIKIWNKKQEILNYLLFVQNQKQLSISKFQKYRQHYLTEVFIFIKICLQIFMKLSFVSSKSRLKNS